MKEQSRSKPNDEELRALLQKANGAVPADYLDLMAEHGELYMEVDLNIEGHEGKKRRLSIWAPRYCGVVPAEFKGDESCMLPPYMLVGGDGDWHRLAYSGSMNPPGYYRLSQYRACFGEQAPVFISGSLEGLLVRGEGLVAFFEPRRLEDEAYKRLRSFSAGVRAELLTQRPDGVDEASWSYASHNDKPAVHDLISNYLNIDIEEPEALGLKCRKSENTSARVQEFKVVLKAALDEPGLITPWMYEWWSHGHDEYDTQDKLQAHLHELWDLCFPAEPRHDAPRRSIWERTLWWSTEAGHRKKQENQEGWERARELMARVVTELKLENDSVLYYRYTQVLEEAQSVHDPALEESDWQTKILERALVKFFPAWRGVASSSASLKSPTLSQ